MTHVIAAAFSLSWILVRAAIGWRGSAFMASAGSSGNGTAKGLVVNALVLWNTRYMDAALSQLRSQGAEVKPEDVARRPRTRSRLG